MRSSSASASAGDILVASAVLRKPDDLRGLVETQLAGAVDRPETRALALTHGHDQHGREDG